MNKGFMKEYLSHEPADLNSSYIFLTDNKNLALMIAGSGFGAQALSEDPDDEEHFYSVESFMDCLTSSEQLGTCRMDYTYVAACFHKKKNDQLEKFFKKNSHLNFISGWRLFRNKEYLAKPRYQEDLSKLLKEFIYHHEGPRADARLSKSSDDKSGDEVIQNEMEDSGHHMNNGWFTADDAIREKVHTFNKDGKPNGVLDSAVIDCIITHVHLFILEMTVYLYKEGLYVQDTKGSQTRELIRSLLYPQMMKNTIIKRIYYQLLDRVQLHKTVDQLNRQPRHWVNFQNGYFDVISWKLIEHDPKYLTVNQLPYRIDPDWKPPDSEYITNRFLTVSVSDEDDRKTLWEFMGYSMTTDTRFQKFVVLTGPGGTGKSVVIAMMEDIVGKDNTSGISLQYLNMRFYPSALYLKLLNACADIPSTAMESVDNLKKATGEDILPYERKGKDPTFFHSYAKLFFSANKIPLNLDEKSDAFYRRILILTMDHKAGFDDRDLDLREKLADEWQYILYHALCGLKRLYEQGHFTESAKCKEAVRELRRMADNVLAFMDECIRITPGKHVTRSKVYDAYEEYCRDNKRQSCGKGRFFERMNEFYQIKRYATEGFCYQDIQLSEPGEYEEKTIPEGQGFIGLEPDEQTPFDLTEKKGDHKL